MPGGSGSIRLTPGNLEPSTVRVPFGHGDESRARGTTPLPGGPAGRLGACTGPISGTDRSAYLPGRLFVRGSADGSGANRRDRSGAGFQSPARPPWWICPRLFSVVASDLLATRPCPTGERLRPMPYRREPRPVRMPKRRELPGRRGSCDRGRCSRPSDRRSTSRTWCRSGERPR